MNIGGYEVVLSVDDFSEKGGANGVDEVGGKESATEIVGWVLIAAFFVVIWGFFEEEVTPKFGGVDAAVFDDFEGGFDGVDVVKGEEAGDAEGAGFGGDEAGHPVVTVDEIGFYGGNDVVDDFALEGEGDFEVNGIGVGVDAVLVVKDAIFGEVNAVFGEFAFVDEEFVVDKTAYIDVEHFTVVGECDVDIGSEFVQGGDE